MTNKEIGCTECPYAGHFVLKECPDAYTDVSKYCGLYNHEPSVIKVKTEVDAQLVSDELRRQAKIGVVLPIEDIEVKWLERPQGEWIIVKDEKWGDNVKCPFCGKELAGTDLNFCCKCGAKLICSEKMNGGAE